MEHYKEMFDLTGKKAMVTGGAGDLGTGMVEGLVQSGAEVCIIDIMDSAADMAAKYQAEGKKVYSVKVDVADREQLRA
ncbi:MAG: SDR family NAD(P)-dependent oxidoreductase, partial [Christensenellaceae bacterium]|nr:SDR family NAD(P)-dependent oxidoreductase [Christensenellaceae bacterium]